MSPALFAALLLSCDAAVVLSGPGDVAQVDGACEGVSRPALVINELVSANVHGGVDEDGASSDWIELANLGEARAGLAGWALTDDADAPFRWPLPERALGPGEVLLIFASGEDRREGELHADFSIAAEGERLQLTAPDGCAADVVEAPRLYADVAWGRPAEAPETWGYFLAATPGAPNTTEARPGFAAPPALSPAPGFYEAPVSVTAVTETPGATIRYTLVGAEPAADSPRYEGAISPHGEPALAVVRARAWADGLWPSRTTTATYGADRAALDYGLQVVSLVVDPFDLYDHQTGIYTYGPPDYFEHYPYFGANFWEDWERDLRVQIWTPDGTLALDQDAGIKIHGGYTRAFEQKNFRIIPRAAYGPSELAHAFFPDEEQDAFEVIVLEGAGDWCPTHTENAVVYALFRDADRARFDALDTQAWEPAAVYLNGEFWGLYAFREKLDERYVAARHGADPERLDRVECTADGTDDWWRLQQGTWHAFDELNEFVDTHDLSQDDAWAEFAARMDVENLALSVLAEGYWGNSDWWSNNIKMWREREEGAPFRHIVFDLGHGWASYSNDHLGTSAGFSGPGLPIADAMAREEFRALLANQGAELLNTSLRADAALQEVSAMHERIAPIIPDQYAAWCGQPPSAWADSVDYAHQFVTERPAVFWRQLQQHLDLDGIAALTLGADPPGAGHLELTLISVEPPFTGDFFTGIPISVTAVPSEGWRFVGWSDPDLGEGETAVFELEGDREVTALFE